MTILLDPPAWPAHGRTWSHLVSDSSLHELRLFARRAGIPDRAFDVDHYDVPAERYDELVGAGAAPVDGRTLARRLATSGLRVPGHDRARGKPDALRRRWAALWPTGTDARQVAAVGDELVGRWAEAHRVYHSGLHLADTLDALELLLARPVPPGSAASPAPPPAGSGARVAALALWFHDAVHDGATPADEEASAALVADLLAPLAAAGATTSDEVAEVARLVLVTTDHDPAEGDHAGALVSDADLAVLGGEPARYRRYAAQVKAEYAEVPDDAFRAGRTAVLEQLLDLHAGPGLFRTAVGRERWAARAELNLRAELAALRATGDVAP